MRLLKMVAHPIEVMFCEECPHFSQTNLKSEEGWCEKRTDLLCFEENIPQYFYVKKTDFCNGG